MSRWWRAYDEAVDDPKLQRLPPALFKAWFNLMCLASSNGGVFPDLQTIAFKLRVSVGKAASIVNELKKAGLVDDCPDQDDPNLLWYAPHNWNGRQYKSDVSTERVKQFRERQRNVSVTPPETETENRKKDAAPNGAHSEEADLFRRGKETLGKDCGGLVAKLLKAKKGSIPLARAAIEQAATKHDPREYIGRVISGPAAEYRDRPDGGAII